MSNIVMWAEQIQVFDKTKEVLLILAATADIYGRSLFSLNDLAISTNLLKNQVIDELEKLSSRKIIAFIGDGDDFGIPEKLLNMESTLCILRIKIAPSSLT